ncbi:hypothetical protein BVX98_04520, partial [bacterium F11]
WGWHVYIQPHVWSVFLFAVTAGLIFGLAHVLALFYGSDPTPKKMSSLDRLRLFPRLFLFGFIFSLFVAVPLSYQSYPLSFMPFLVELTKGKMILILILATSPHSAWNSVAYFEGWLMLLAGARDSKETSPAEALVTSFSYVDSLAEEDPDPREVSAALKGILRGSPLLMNIDSLDGQIDALMNLGEGEDMNSDRFYAELDQRLIQQYRRPLSKNELKEKLLRLSSQQQVASEDGLALVVLMDRSMKGTLSNTLKRLPKGDKGDRDLFLVRESNDRSNVKIPEGFRLKETLYRDSVFDREGSKGGYNLNWKELKAHLQETAGLDHKVAFALVASSQLDQILYLEEEEELSRIVLYVLGVGRRMYAGNLRRFGMISRFVHRLIQRQA